MATLKRTDWMRWDAQAQKSGFSFDAQHYVVWNEKRVTKKIPAQREGDFYEFILDYTDEREKRGCFWASTGKVVPMLTVNKLRMSSSSKESDRVKIYQSSELHCEQIGDAVDRKNYGALCKFAASVNIPEILKRVRTKYIDEI